MKDSKEVLSLEKYDKYLNGSMFEAVLKTYWDTVKTKKCHVCDCSTIKGDGVYHKNLKSVGMERNTDLVSVCLNCDKNARLVYENKPQWQNNGLFKSIEFARSFYQPKNNHPGKKMAVQRELSEERQGERK